MDPYRLFFPLGVAFGLLGVSPWVLLHFGRAPVSPFLVHPDLMIGGFLWSFAAGFLMTALPRYLGSFAAGRLETLFAAALGVAMLAAGLLPQRVVFHALLLAQIGVVVVFGLRRVRARRVWPPPVFSFVALGLACGLLGAALLAGWEAGRLGPRAALFGRTLLYHGMMPAFVLGVGSGLLTAMFGWKQATLVKLGRPGEAHVPWSARAWREPGALVLCFVAGLVVDPLGWAALGRALRAGCLSWVAVRAWRAYRPPLAPGRLVRWTWVATIAVVVGAWAHVFGDSRAADAVHALFIPGLSLMALMVAGRVTLVHGGHGVGAERRWRSISGTGWLLLLAAVGRVLAPWTGAAYVAHLAYAGLLWTLGLLVWAAAFVPAALAPRKPRRAPAG